jgi:hypothetical protein
MGRFAVLGLAVDRCGVKESLVSSIFGEIRECGWTKRKLSQLFAG